MTRFKSVFCAVVPAAALVVGSGEAWAQSASPSRFNRTRSGTPTVAASGARSGRAAAVDRTAASRLGEDPLAPYTSKPPLGTYVAPPPERRPAPTPVVRNYFPTAGTGQYRSQPVGVHHHCTPSRASVHAPGR